METDDPLHLTSPPMRHLCQHDKFWTLDDLKNMRRGGGEKRKYDYSSRAAIAKVSGRRNKRVEAKNFMSQVDWWDSLAMKPCCKKECTKELVVNADGTETMKELYGSRMELHSACDLMEKRPVLASLATKHFSRNIFRKLVPYTTLI